MHNSANTHIPEEYICPISQHLMHDPVIIADGALYDRSSITDWFQNGNTTSPLTGTTLEHLNVIPVHALRSLIEKYRKEVQEQDGHRVEAWADGGRFEGNFKNGKREGFGTEYWSDGGGFSGYYKEGKREGPGKEHWSDGGGFEGMYVGGQRNGKGKELWSDGGWFEGSYKDGLKNGHGIQYLNDGSSYEGGFKNGKRHGPGTYRLVVERE